MGKFVAALLALLSLLLPLVAQLLLLLLVVLDHAHKAHKLISFDLFWIQVVWLRHVEVGDDILGRVRLHHLLIEQDFVVKLLVSLLLEVVDESDLGRVVLDHQLGRD